MNQGVAKSLTHSGRTEMAVVVFANFVVRVIKMTADALVTGVSSYFFIAAWL